MARKGITYDQVSNAASAIKARGSEPTVSAVRVELGNEGSYTTISQHLSKWKSEDAERVDARSLPPQVEDKAMEAITVIWNIANKAASEETAALKQAHNDELKVLRQELKDATQEIEKLDAALEEMEKHEIESAKRAEQYALENNGLKKELDATKALYAELLKTLKQPDDKKPARQSPKQSGSGNKPADNPAH